MSEPHFQKFQGHEIHAYNPVGLNGSRSWKFAVTIDGEKLRSPRGRIRIFTTVPAALSAARRHLRKLARAQPFAAFEPAQCPKCGASLAYVAGGGGTVVICPSCDAETLAELQDEIETKPPELDLRPESYVAHMQRGKYVIAVTHKGRPIGNDPARLHAETEFLPYYHPYTPAPGEPKCTFLIRGERRCRTLEEALERCRDHAAGEQLAAAPTAPGADA